jgi:hypothetical protein
MMEKTVVEKEKKRQILCEADVLVLGGGPAGIAAAVAAVDAGASVIIIERYGFLGGIPTICNMEPSSWCRQEETVMPGGVQAMLEKKMLERGAAYPSFFQPSASLVYDTEIMKQVLDDLILEHQVKPLFHCIISEPYFEDGHVRGVFVDCKSGRVVVLGKRIIDCTGDADFAALCGCPFEKCNLGPDESKDLMFGTTIFGISDVDTQRVMENLHAHPEMLDRVRHEFISDGFKKAIAEGYPVPPEGFADKVIFNRMTKGEVTAVNRVRVPVDGNDVFSITEAEIKSRKVVLATLELLKRYEPGFEDAKLRNFATAMGVRETRRIKGNYQLTQDDVDGECRFDDSVGVYPICYDGPAKCSVATDAYFHIPFGILVPQGVENVLVAGRCVSATKNATHTTRGVDFAFASGQAVGVASALSIQQNKTSRNVDIAKLQKELERQGVRMF